MKTTILNYEIKFYPGMNPGKKDKRYKSGYSIPPHPIVNYALNLCVENPNGELRAREHLRSTLGEKYLVTTVDNINKKAMLMACRVSMDASYLSIENKPIELISCGFVAAEGSVGT